MEDIMDIIFTTHKRKHLDTIEKYHIPRKQKKAYRLMTEVLLLKTQYLM